MNAEAVMPAEAREYVERVRIALADLPAEEREELLADLETSLREGSGEGVASPEQRLGTAEAFAADLRAAAGLKPPAAPGPDTGSASGWSQFTAAVSGFAKHPATAATIKAGRELAPVWWVARAFLILAIFGVVLAQPQNLGGLPMLGGVMFNLMVLGVIVVGSVAAGLIGRRLSGPARAVLVVANIALVLVALPYGERAARYVLGSPYVEAQTTPMAFMYEGAQIMNVYAYDRDGKLLQDVRLYDQNGTPLAIYSDESVDPDRRRVFDRSGEEVFNAFPIRHREPGSRKVSDPEAGAPPKPPALKTPALKSP